MGLHRSYGKVHVVGRLVGLEHTQSKTPRALLWWVSGVVVAGQANVLRRIESYDFGSQLRKNFMRITFVLKGFNRSRQTYKIFRSDTKLRRRRCKSSNSMRENISLFIFHEIRCSIREGRYLQAIKLINERLEKRREK